MQKLNNKTALITGGTSGMGFATAQEFIDQGAKVIITGRHQETIDETVKKLGSAAFGFVSDAGSMDDISELRQQVKKYSNSIDILYVNAGYGKFAPVEMVDETLFDELFNTLAKGTFFTVQQILPLINEEGSIILNTSVVTESGYPNMSVYSAAKSAVQSFIKTYAAECVAKKIRVNGISPGYIKTNGFQKTGMSQEQIDETVKGIIPTIPFKRFGSPGENAKTVSFLASDDASYIHGTEIVVDSGLSVLN